MIALHPLHRHLQPHRPTLGEHAAVLERSRPAHRHHVHRPLRRRSDAFPPGRPTRTSTSLEGPIRAVVTAHHAGLGFSLAQQLGHPPPGPAGRALRQIADRKESRLGNLKRPRFAVDAPPRARLEQHDMIRLALRRAQEQADQPRRRRALRSTPPRAIRAPPHRPPSRAGRSPRPENANPAHRCAAPTAPDRARRAR